MIEVQENGPLFFDSSVLFLVKKCFWWREDARADASSCDVHWCQNHDSVMLLRPINIDQVVLHFHEKISEIERTSSPSVVASLWSNYFFLFILLTKKFFCKWITKDFVIICLDFLDCVEHKKGKMNYTEYKCK